MVIRELPKFRSQLNFQNVLYLAAARIMEKQKYFLTVCNNTLVKAQSVES